MHLTREALRNAVLSPIARRSTGQGANGSGQVGEIRKTQIDSDVTER